MIVAPTNDGLDDHAALEVFLCLVTGLHGYVAGRDDLPPTFRRALNLIALKQRTEFPKTLHAFIRDCHRPVSAWYPFPIPAPFNPTQSVLVAGQLSEEAHAFCLELSDRLDLTLVADAAHLPQTALDNLAIRNLRERLKAQHTPAAQQLYCTVRSFVIEHSCFTVQTFRRLPLDVQAEIKPFMEDVLLPSDHLPVCDRCGLLEWRDEGWHGIKPEYCSDHGAQSGLVQWIANPPGGLQRLKRGIHLRTFLPGRAELAVFTFAEALRDQFPQSLLNIERYPGFDTYDLRLTFANTVWAVDVKDHASAERFVEQVTPLYALGDLRYHKAFYVVPDARLEDPHYTAVVKHKRENLPRSLDIVSVSVFQQAVQAHIDALRQPRRKSSRKQV